MTKLSRAVVRETAYMDHRTRRPVLIRLEAGGKLVRLKAKGTRTWYTLTVGAIWLVAGKRRAIELAQERQKGVGAKGRGARERSQ